MSADPDDNAVTFIRTNDYVLQIIVKAWRAIAFSLALFAVLSGLVIEFGPSGSRASVAFRVMANIGVANNVLAWLLILSGVLMLIPKFSWTGHIVSAVCYSWFGLVVLYIVFLLQTETTLTAAVWALGLSLVHFIAAWGQITIWVFLRRSGRERSTGGGERG